MRIGPTQLEAAPADGRIDLTARAMTRRFPANPADSTRPRGAAETTGKRPLTGKQPGWVPGDEPISAEEVLARAQLAMTPATTLVALAGQTGQSEHVVTRLGCGPAITDAGWFWLLYYVVDEHPYVVVLRAELDVHLQPVFRHPERVLLRIDSACWTGMIFGEKSCECPEELHESMAAIAETGEGAIVHCLADEGRAMGLAFKLASFILQRDGGMDTVQAAEELAGCALIDKRDYRRPVAIIRALGLIPGQTRIRLMANNPQKVASLTSQGYTVEPVPLVIPATNLTRKHLAAKARRLGHRNLLGALAAEPDGEQHREVRCG